MRMEDRRPRETRFQAEDHEARLARLRQQAPMLTGGARLRWYAILGSLLMLITVVGFYVAMQIHKAVAQDRERAALIEVEQAPPVAESETEKALQRAQAEQAAADAAAQAELERLKQVDLLGEMDAPNGG